MSSSTYYKPAANHIDSMDKQSNNRGGMWEDITRSSERDGKVKRENQTTQGQKLHKTTKSVKNALWEI